MLTHPLLISYCVSQFLTGRGVVLVHGLGVGDPYLKELEKEAKHKATRMNEIIKIRVEIK